MSIIAGCSLFNGVILLADCRLTIKQPGSKDILCDNAQKLFPLTNNTALGFVGDLNIASPIIRELFRQVNLSHNKGKTNRLHPLSMLKWLPRYFRSIYRQVEKRQKIGRVDFMVGSIILDRPNIINQSKVVEIMERFRLRKTSIQRNWIPDILIKIMQANTPNVILTDVPANLLYSMKSPDFIPQHLAPLEFAAIGSGQDTIIAIDRYADWIFAGIVGNSFMEANALRQTVSTFIEENSILTVGGMYPAIKINRDGVEFLGYSSTIPAGGPRFELSVNQDGRWLQKNNATGKEITLLLPWEINPKILKKDERFDDLKDALNNFRTGNA